MKDNEDGKTLTTPEVARILGISRRHATRLVTQYGKLQGIAPILPRGQHKIPVGEVVELLRRNNREVPQELLA